MGVYILSLIHLSSCQGFCQFSCWAKEARMTRGYSLKKIIKSGEYEQVLRCYWIKKKIEVPLAFTHR